MAAKVAGVRHFQALSGTLLKSRGFKSSILGRYAY